MEDVLPDVLKSCSFRPCEYMINQPTQPAIYLKRMSQHPPGKENHGMASLLRLVVCLLGTDNNAQLTRECKLRNRQGYAAPHPKRDAKTGTIRRKEEFLAGVFSLMTGTLPG